MTSEKTSYLKNITCTTTVTICKLLTCC